MRKVTGNNPNMPYSAQISQKQDEHNIYVILKAYMLLWSSHFCKIWALCVAWITYDHLYYTPCLACWALFGLLVPAMCNGTSCAQVYELPQSHCGDNRGHIVFMCVYIYIYTHTPCKGIFLSNVNWRHAWGLCFKSIFILVTTLGGDFRPFIQQVFL